MSRSQLEQLRPMLAAVPAKLQGDLDQVRRNFDEMLAQFPPPPGVAFEPENPDGMPAHWCVPSGAAPGRVLLYLHGGGYILGSSIAYRPLASEFAARMKTRVLIPDYRLAPEHPFPAALEDSIQAYRWLLDRGIAAKSIALAGDSCGGGLVMATLVGIRDAGLPLPAGAAIISPWADLEVASESFTSKAAEDPLLNADALRGMAAAYLGGASPRTPGASPIYANLAGLPPLLIQVGAAEVLLDDSTRLAARAGADGVKVRLDIWPEMFHVWHGYAPLLDEGKEALDDAALFLAGLFAQRFESAA